MAIDSTNNEATLQLCDLMVVAINDPDNAWEVVFVAESQYEQRELLQSERVLVLLCPETPDVSTDRQQLSVELTVIGKVAKATRDDCDPIWNLYHQIRDFLSEQRFTINGEEVTWNPPGKPQWDRDRLATERVVSLVGNLHYLQYLYLDDVTP